jgi:hypothetical protein
MRADKGISDSRTEWALQDLLIDVAAVVAATEPDRARNASELTRRDSGASRKSSPACQVRTIAGIRGGSHRS